MQSVFIGVSVWELHSIRQSDRRSLKELTVSISLIKSVFLICFIFRSLYPLFFLSSRFLICSASALGTQLHPWSKACPLIQGPWWSSGTRTSTLQHSCFMFCLCYAAVSNNDTFNTNTLLLKISLALVGQWAEYEYFKNTGTLVLTKERKSIQGGRWGGVSLQSNTILCPVNAMVNNPQLQ